MPQLGGGTLELGTPKGAPDWQMVIVYRGLHCPAVQNVPQNAGGADTALYANGIDVVAVSGDPQDKAQAFADEVGLSLPVGYDLSTDQMRALGVYISEPRSPQESGSAVFPSRGCL